MAAGSVNTHAISRLRTVAHCSPEPFAAIVPATPDDNTCVVETGSPYISAAAIVPAATTSAQADPVRRTVAEGLAGIDAITANSYTVRSTINPLLQRAVEGALQEGLSRYEGSAGRVQFGAAEANLAQAVQRTEASSKTGDRRPAWQRAAC